MTSATLTCSNSNDSDLEMASSYECSDTETDTEIPGEGLHDMNRDPRRNLGTYTATERLPFLEELFSKTIGQIVHQGMWSPGTQEARVKCENFLRKLYHATDERIEVMDVTGSSEAALVAVCTYRDAKKSASKPYILVPDSAHICWNKAAHFANVTTRSYNPDDLLTLETQITSNCVAVVCTVGTSKLGEIDPVEDICQVVKSRNKKVPVHVDAASGGFVFPFTDPNFEFDFRQQQVAGVNVCSHKFGNVPAALAWLLIKPLSPEGGKRFTSSYTGNTVISRREMSYTRAAFPLLVQSELIQRWGYLEYQKKTNKLVQITQYLARELDRTGDFTILNNGVIKMPVLAFEVTEAQKFMTFMHENNWLVPLSSEGNFRIVVRHGFTMHHAQELLNCIRSFKP